MSQQMADPFVWNQGEYVFLGASNVYDLFDPEAYGLKPEAPHTACWKGFIVHFLLKKNQLFIDKLEVNCENDEYPDINGVVAKKSILSDSFHVYSKLKMPVKYTGTVIVGKELKERFFGRAFTGPHSYATTYELEFEEGVLLDYKETSGIYHGI